MQEVVTPAQEVAAGVLAGVADAVACHPVDVVKTQFHVNRTANGSMSAALLAQARAGGVASLYRGLPAACLRPQALCMYAGNEWAKRFVAGSGELTVRTAPVAGFLTGYLESACVTPFELVKVRMQVKEHVGRYGSTWACARAVVAEEGAAALYRGFGATCARNCTFNGIYFGLIFAGQQALPPRPTLAADAAQNLALGAGAGAAATVVKAPFDVVKSRIQAQLPEPGTGRLAYRHTTQALLAVARAEGLPALWKGLGPMTLRCTLGFSISFAAFDGALALMGAPRAARQAAAAAAAESMPHEG